jgi:DnaJ-class molecular chaperone
MDMYEILGIKSGSSQEVIRHAYKVKAMEAHPDRGGDIHDFIRVSKAYSMLCKHSYTPAYVDNFSGVFSGMSTVPERKVERKVDTKNWMSCYYCFGLGESATGKCPICKGCGRVPP